MIPCDAIVVAVSGGQVWVEVPARAQACANCPTPGGCRTGLLGIGGRPRRYRLDNNKLELCVGDHVNLTVDEGTLWRAACMSYLIPVLMAIGGAAFGQWWGGDVIAMAGMLIGLLLGFVLLRCHGRHTQDAQHPLFLQHQRCPQDPLPKKVIKEIS